MNSWPGPENSWEGVDAYFTSADSEGTLIFWTLVVIALLIFLSLGQVRDTRMMYLKILKNNI